MLILDKSPEDTASLDSREEEQYGEVSRAKFQLNHLGPVSRRERLLHQLGRLSPYLSPVLVLVMLVLLPVVLATMWKVRKGKE